METEEKRYECPVCEKKVSYEPDTICDDCFDKGARASVRW